MTAAPVRKGRQMARNTTAHPLFNSSSLYRLGTRLSVWSAEQGADSIRRFFESLRLEALEADWLAATSRELDQVGRWDFGFDDETNERIRKQRLPAQTGPVPPSDADQERIRSPVRIRGGVRARPADGFDNPGLLVLDVSGGAPVRLREGVPVPETAFTGASKDRQSETIKRFQAQIRLGKEQEMRECLLLLLTRTLVEKLAGLLAVGPSPRVALPTRPIPTRVEGDAVITRALAPDMLAVADDASQGKVWLASRLSMVLGCAAGYQHKVQDLHFSCDIELAPANPERNFPHLPDDSWVLICVGG